nr:MAG TPA: hypothetical protein [Caudoviricetes sp.]DAY53545.1 MAG TPA: hypothetical protein [Caudoviricetes sp.]
MSIIICSAHNGRTAAGRNSCRYFINIPISRFLY